MPERCPVNTLINILSKRWVIFIFYSIKQGKTSFNDIKRMNLGMSAKILSERLKELENEGFIERKIINDRPISVEYTFTPKGESLQGVLMKVNDWAIQNKDLILEGS